VPRTNQAYPPEFRREAIRLLRASQQEHPIPRGSPLRSVSPTAPFGVGLTKTQSTAATEKG
jgi:hypothetical protein